MIIESDYARREVAKINNLFEQFNKDFENESLNSLKSLTNQIKNHKKAILKEFEKALNLDMDQLYKEIERWFHLVFDNVHNNNYIRQIENERNDLTSALKSNEYLRQQKLSNISPPICK